MLARVQNLWQRAKGAPLETRRYWLSMGAVLVLGVFLRLNGYLGHHISFWLDEALWAPRFLDRPMFSLGIRPVGYVWLTRLIVNAFGPTEVWFRLLPNLGALGSLALMPYVASRLLEGRLWRLALVLLFAIHPALVDFANEFKPYSFEVLVHLLPVALYLRFEQTGRLRVLYALLLYLPLAFLFAYNMAFAFPGLLLLALRSAWQRSPRRRLLTATLLSGALCAGTVSVVYQRALAHVAREEHTEGYWGKKYDVFYRDDSGQTRVDWTLEKYEDLTALIGLRRHLWSDPGKLPSNIAKELGALDRWLWFSLSIAGLYGLWQHRRRRHLLLLLALPVLTLTLVNALGKWPFGAFRTNLFLAVYLFPVPLIGCDWLSARHAEWRRVLSAAILLTCILPGFLFGFDLHGHKRTWTRDHYAREVIERLHALRLEQLSRQPRAARARLVLDLHTYRSLDYYLHLHPAFRATYERFFARNFAIDEVGSKAVGDRVRRRLKDASQVWVVTSSALASDALAELTKKGASVLTREPVMHQHLIEIIGRK